MPTSTWLVCVRLNLRTAKAAGAHHFVGVANYVVVPIAEFL